MIYTHLPILEVFGDLVVITLSCMCFSPFWIFQVFTDCLSLYLIYSSLYVNYRYSSIPSRQFKNRLSDT